MKDNTNTSPSILPALFFDAAAESPGAWLLRAFELKTAAERLDWIAKPITDEENALSLMGPYRLLMALSFENILKGILVAQGNPVFVNGKFNKKFDHHDLERLALAVDLSTFSFSPEEITILRNQNGFISWAGRYPIPKTANEYQPARWHSSVELAAENQLWHRLSEYFSRIAYIMKGGPEATGGSRLYFDKARRGER